MTDTNNSNKQENVQELLQELHTLTVKELLQIIRSGEVSSAELRVIKDFLKDNNIEALPTPQKDMKDIHDNLPFQLSEYDRDLQDEADSASKYSAG